MKSFLKYWLPVMIWLGVIFIASSNLMSADQTSRIIEPLLRWLIPDISPEAVAQTQFFVRKAAHVIEYAILAILLVRALGKGTSLQMRLSILYVSVWVGSTLVATADEFHQSFVASRSSSPGDVMIDSAAALLALLISWRWSRRDRSPRN